MFRKALFTSLVIFLLAGCAGSDNTLSVQPKIVLPRPDPAMTAITISVNSADLRSDQVLAKVNRGGQLVSLVPSRDIRFLLQEVLEKQMSARGYMLGPDGQVNLRVVINQLAADVSQGDVRYSIATKADISLIAIAKNGQQQTRTYRQTYSVEGPFVATNQKITDAINIALNDMINDMAQDTSIHQFIKQNAH